MNSLIDNADAQISTGSNFDNVKVDWILALHDCTNFNEPMIEETSDIASNSEAPSLYKLHPAQSKQYNHCGKP